MGFYHSKKSRVGPLVNTYKLDIEGNKFTVVKYNDYINLYSKNTNLTKEVNDLNQMVNKLQNSNFECMICYCKNSSVKKKTKCGHDLCINCYYLIKNKTCPYCSKKI
jgi:hypothetical protein